MGLAAIDKYTTDIVAIDRDNVWHHLTQHQIFDSTDPMVIVEGDGMRVRDATGKEYLDAVLRRPLDRQRWLWPKIYRPRRTRSIIENVLLRQQRR